MAAITIRASNSSPSDATQIPRLLNAAIPWLNSIGYTHWGVPSSTPRPNPMPEVTPGAFETGCAWFAVTGEGTPEEKVLGVMVLSVKPASYCAPTAEERLGKEAFLKLLVTDREAKGLGVGELLLGFGKEECRRRRLEWLRSDCFRALEEDKDLLVK